ncbi:hypothetical protein CLOP_g7298 [Closterium sp. NIES-67]|nr:hypothetical protein CLOP_g7298 [Closterium sp. NIES-67]
MVLLRQTLRSLCSPDGWTYAVFWKLKRRNRMVLTWEDGYCSMDTPGGVPKEQSADNSSIDGNLLGMAVAKMSYHIYSFGEGVVGRVAFSGKHQWIFAPRFQGVPGLDSRHGFSSMKGYGGCTGVDKYPSGWDDQFAAGVKTIAVIAVPEGVLQLGSSRSMPEDLKFVSHIRSLFAALQTVPGAFLSDLFSENALKAKAFPTSGASALAAAGFPPDIAASLGDCNPQSSFLNASFPGALSRQSVHSNQQNIQMSVAPTPPPAAPPAPSRPLAENPLAGSSPSDLFSLLGIPSDGSPVGQNARFMSSAPLKPSVEPKQEVASFLDMPSTAKRAKVAPERTTRASVAINQIQLNFFDADIGGAPLPPQSLGNNPVDRSSRLSRHSSPNEASAHVLGPSGELLGRGAEAAGAGAGAKAKAVVDLEKELRMFHENFLNDSSSPSLANLPLPTATSAVHKPVASSRASVPAAVRAPAGGNLGNLGVSDADLAGRLAGLDEQMLAGMTASSMAASDGLFRAPMLGNRSAGLPPVPQAAGRNGNAAALASQFKSANGGGGEALTSASAFGGADELAQALGLHFTGQLPADLAELADLADLADIGAAQMSANGQFGNAMSRGVFAQPGAPGGARLAADAGGFRGGFSMASGPPQLQKQHQQLLDQDMIHRAAVSGSVAVMEKSMAAAAANKLSANRLGAAKGGVGMGNSSLDEMERMATLEALMRTSGLLPPLSLAELQQGHVSSKHNPMAAAAAAVAVEAIGAGRLSGLQSRASIAGRAAGDGERGAKGMADAMLAKEAGVKGALKPFRATPDVASNAGLKELFGQLAGGGAAAADAAAAAAAAAGAAAGGTGKEDKRGMKKRGREEKPKQRPRDRQLIQDRVKDLRGIVPNSERLSIDGLLERTIQHLVFLREFASLRSDIEKGQAMLEEKSFDECMSECPVLVQHLSPTLVQIKVEWVGGTVPIDLADGLRQIGLVVRKSSVRSSGGRVKAHIIAQCKQPLERMDIMWHLLQHLKDKLPGLTDRFSGATEMQARAGELDAVVKPADSCRQVMYPVGVISA